MPPLKFAAPRRGPDCPALQPPLPAAILVANMLWSRQQHVFVVEAYFSNGRSVIVVQWAFHRHFHHRIPPRDRVCGWSEMCFNVDGCLPRNRECLQGKERISEDR
ncbi:hypothetical protein TNCV_4386181 [Trichonephila clavipes]|nr:hypothetical protein TNCV_4386181 [Trichonephila clavipes]